MPDLEFSCPSCQQSLEAPAEMAGETVECPNCGQVMLAPGPAREEATLADIAFGEDSSPPMTAADVISGAEPNPASSDDPHCPECGADMEPAAVLCVQCGFHRRIGKKIPTELG